MLKNYLKTAVRNLRKQRTHSVINIAGLAVGMAVFILILSYVWFELSFDRYHTNTDQIYRVVQSNNNWVNVSHWAGTGNLVVEALLDEFPEILHATRLGLGPDIDLHYKSDTKIVKTNREYLRVDSSIFNIFNIPLVSGDPRTALTDPNSIILTQKLAVELYGDEDPMGKIITITQANTKQAALWNPNKDFIVTGVAKAMPGNSHIDFQFLVPYGKNWNYWYTGNIVFTYILLPEDYAPEDLEEKFPMIIGKYFGPAIEKQHGMSYDEWVKSDGFYTLNLQPLKDIHLNSKYTDGWGIGVRQGNKTNIYLFSLIATFILLLACINFMIMSTARSENRAKEVGVRKIQGAYRKQLIGQFLSESVLLSLLALILSILLVTLLFPTFNGLVGRQITLAFSSVGFIIIILVTLALLVGILAGSYPAFFLSAIQSIIVLKGGIKGKTKGLTLRNGLIVFQFIISITLIFASLVLYSQLFFMQENDQGLNKENIVVIPNMRTMFISINEKEEGYKFHRDNWAQISQSFRQELLKHSHLIKATGSTHVPGSGYNSRTECHLEGANADEFFNINWIGADPAYIETFGMKLIAGHNYTTFIPNHSSMPYSPEGVVINEAAVKSFGWKEPLGETFIYKGWGFEQKDGKVDSASWIQQDFKTQVIGVIEDYHFQSLRSEIKPMAFYPAPGFTISAKIQPDDIPGTLKFIEDTWKSFTPDVPFAYSFLDDDLENLYGKEKRLGKIFLYFTLLAVIIACLGLFGLAAFTTEQRSKEIGVRKVMGASFRDIIRLLSKTYIILILIASLIAWPIAYIAMHRWLQDFAYRVNIGAGIFLLTGLIALIIVAIAVSSQAIKASLTDPVESLRYE